MGATSQMKTEVIHGMPAEEYFALPGLSFSAMKDLAISSMRYWYLHLNPDRPVEEPTAEMRIGSALHTAVLEPGEFRTRYACEIDPADYPGCLITMDDLKGWLGDRGLPTSAKRKSELVERVFRADPTQPVLETIEKSFEEENAGKTMFKKADWLRIEGAADALRSEPRFMELLATGESEVCMVARDPQTGVLLKCRMDWVSQIATVDVKTFSQQRSKSIDKSIADAIYYERYHWQAYLYSLVRSLQKTDDRSGPQKAPQFINAFVESDAPHEVRLKALRSTAAGEANLFWLEARNEVHALINRYAECKNRFGLDPWRERQELDALQDCEIKALAYS
jgi:hypothetical protein